MNVYVRILSYCYAKFNPKKGLKGGQGILSQTPVFKLIYRSIPARGAVVSLIAKLV